MRTTPRHIVAHRGLARLFPENTLAAVQGALDAGLSQVEIDIQLSADGVPLLWHDAALARMSGRSGDVRELGWARLQRLSAHEPGRFGRRFVSQRPCSLEELALELAPQAGLKRLFVELKRESLQRFGREAVLAACAQALAPLRGRCVLISFDLPVLALARRATRFPIGLVLGSLRQWRSPAARALRCDWAFINERLLPRSGPLKPLFGRARSCAYELAEPLRARDLLRRGLHAVESFRADTLLQELALYR
jgi:glycerophosphoryl diester phosphodiesterase